MSHRPGVPDDVLEVLGEVWAESSKHKRSGDEH